TSSKRDWSSDVCSSDLDLLAQHPPCLLWGEAGLETGQRDRLERLQSPAVGLGREDQLAGGAGAAHQPVVRADGEGEAEVVQAAEIGRASWRERGGEPGA